MGDFKKISKFKIVDKLGEGSFGVVYKGHDPHLKRDVAIKVCSVDDEGLRKRFLREAEISGRLQHRRIVTVFAFGFEESHSVPYLVQEYLDGEDLRSIIKRQEPLGVPRKLDILIQAAEGLAYAHAQDVVHRDIKPANLRILGDGGVKIMDFGIAKLASAETQLTQKGVTMGTASYLPPEQVRGSDVDHRADIFSFGVLAYELLTYERPFRGNTLSALVYQILYKAPPAMTEIWPECPRELSDMVARCMEKKVEKRWASFDELIPVMTTIQADLEAGKWPVLLRRPGTPADGAAQLDESDVWSRSSITRTVQEVTGQASGDATVSTTVASTDLRRSLERFDPESTQSVGPPEVRAVEEGPTVEMPAVPPPPAAPPAVPPPASAPPVRADPQTDPLLAEKARQISSLIARGDLDTALEQLEETRVRWRKGSDPGSLLAEPVPAPTEPPALQVSPDATTRPFALPPVPGGPTTPPVPVPAPPATPSASQVPPARPPAAAPAFDATAPAPPAAEQTRSGSYMTLLLALPRWQRWAGIAAAVLVVTGALYLLLSSGETAPEPPPPETPEPVSRPVEALPTAGTILVRALPWAEITEILDADGYVKDLPAVRFTPVRLSLPPGRYRLQLEYPASDVPQDCTVDVTAGGGVDCVAEFPRGTVLDYFKESGWWR